MNKIQELNFQIFAAKDKLENELVKELNALDGQPEYALGESLVEILIGIHNGKDFKGALAVLQHFREVAWGLKIFGSVLPFYEEVIRLQDELFREAMAEIQIKAEKK